MTYFLTYLLGLRLWWSFFLFITFLRQRARWVQLHPSSFIWKFVFLHPFRNLPLLCTGWRGAAVLWFMRQCLSYVLPVTTSVWSARWRMDLPAVCLWASPWACAEDPVLEVRLFDISTIILHSTGGQASAWKPLVKLTKSGRVLERVDKQRSDRMEKHSWWLPQ